eukprot:2569261-Prymnesium_polylepis.1
MRVRAICVALSLVPICKTSFRRSLDGSGAMCEGWWVSRGPNRRDIWFQYGIRIKVRTVLSTVSASLSTNQKFGLISCSRAACQHPRQRPS